MGRYVTAIVSKSALRHNLRQVRKIAPHSKVIAMVKANGYGHGLRLAGKTFDDEQIEALGVACIEEGLILRQNGVKADILLMEGIFKEEELPIVQQNNFTLIIHHWFQIQALQNFENLSKPFKVWLKVNTGMNRLGFLPTEFDEAYSTIVKMPKVDLIGFMTHFPVADEKQNETTVKQCEAFSKIIGDRPGQKSLANSAGIIGWPQSHADWVRPGLILYGASPFTDINSCDLNLKPAMTLGSEIIAIQSVMGGEKVGYGGTWTNPKTSKIGIVAIGYGDGYPWHAKNGTPILVNQQRAFLAGRVSMDMLAVDITHLNEVKIGDQVILWGEGLPIEDVARFASTIPYELFCRFTERVTMKVVN